MFTVTKNLRINELLSKFPEAISVLKNAGLKCFDCKGGSPETLEKVVMERHQKTEVLDKIIEKLQKLINELESLPEQKPQDSDFALQEIIEGQKKYYKIGGLTFTQNAYDNLHHLATGAGLAFSVEKGGCSGFQYKYDFTSQKKPSQHEFNLSSSLSVYLDDFSFGKLKGSVIDFKIGLHDAGLKIINPNTKNACSCGSSIGF